MERERGIAVGNAIVAARSAAAFYSMVSLRDAWTLTFIRDLLNGDGESSLPNPYHTIHTIFPQWARAVREFCVGKISISMFRLMGDNSIVPVSRTREANVGGVPDNVTDDIRYANPPAHNNFDARTWQHAVKQVATIANDSYCDTDLKIEFERVYELDTLSGGGPLSTANFHHNAVTTAESVKAIAPFGFLNRAAIFSGTEGTDCVHYKSYMFGSNILLFDNDLTNYGLLDSSMPTGTDKRHLQRALDMSDIELKRFISNIITVSGGTVVNQRRDTNELAKRRKRKHESSDDDEDKDHAPYEGCVKFTSFNRLNNSIQFTFNTQGNRHYFTANVLLLKADDFCTNDLVYRRAAVSSLCQCERPTLVWRVCMLVTPINCATVEGASRVEVTKVVMAAFTAFRAVYQNKKSTVDSRMAVISGFLALPILPFLDKITRPKHNGRENGVISLAKLCVFHRWLRAHSGSRWRTLNGKGSAALIDAMNRRGGRALIVQRPIFMTGMDTASAGKRSFMRFMTYEDAIRKVLRLTESSLINGLSDPNEDNNCMVAYVRGQNDLIVFEHPGSKFVRDDDNSLTAQEQELVGGPSHLWQALFEAPSYLYVDLSVLVSIGYNIVDLARGGRMFEHEDYNTGYTCMVFSSILLRIVKDPTYQILNEQDDNIASINQNAYTRYTDEAENYRGLKILHGKDNRFDLNGGRDLVHSRFHESRHDVSAFWPGVYMIKTNFVDPELKHLCFVYFTGNDQVQMTLENLYAFSNYCSRESLIPPPILYTIQRMVLKGLYT